MSMRVSIHAPVWGATDVSSDDRDRMMFQSTHPCGVRPQGSRYGADVERFNPRTRVGCDRYFGAELVALGVSIHAPVWGATIGLFMRLTP